MLNVESMIGRVRALTNQRVSVEDQGFFTDEEIKGFLEQNWYCLHKQMVEARELYFKKEETIQLKNGNQFYNFEGDFYKILKVDYEYGTGFFLNIPQIGLRDENKYENESSYLWDFPYIQAEENRTSRGYILCGSSQIKIIPRLRAQGKFKIQWIPDSPLIDDPNINLPRGFDNWIVYSTAIDISIPEEGDTRNLEKKQMFWMDKISLWMNDRSNLDPRSIHKKINYHGNSEEGFYFNTDEEY